MRRSASNAVLDALRPIVSMILVSITLHWHALLNAWRCKFPVRQNIMPYLLMLPYSAFLSRWY
ncbi:hypothetical protein BKM09_002590 [Pseudomonas amygdali pv. morsprunorum]|nr:hypothetical protein BKM09_002590 [Pseudomonas amygdali pv. morsprunorum]